MSTSTTTAVQSTNLVIFKQGTAHIAFSGLLSKDAQAITFKPRRDLAIQGITSRAFTISELGRCPIIKLSKIIGGLSQADQDTLLALVNGGTLMKSAVKKAAFHAAYKRIALANAMEVVAIANEVKLAELSKADAKAKAAETVAKAVAPTTPTVKGKAKPKKGKDKKSKTA